MPISDWSTDPDANGTALTIDISEGCNARDINNAIREVMAGVREYADDPRIGGDLTAGVQLLRADGAIGMAGNLSMQSFKVKDLPWPDAFTDNDAVPASWVDGFYQKKGTELLNTIFPAGPGIVIITLNNTNPGVWLGGTWARIGEGRCLIGVGATTDTRGENRTIGHAESGGEFQHVLTVSEMPAHTHPYSSQYLLAGGNADIGERNPSGPRTTGSAGGNLPHNNMQPYLAVYFWYRVS